MDVRVARLKSLAVAWLASLLALPASAAELATPQQLREDLQTIADTLRDQHPETSHSVAPASLRRALASARARLDAPMDRDQAWLQLAPLNSVLADAHTLVAYPDWRGDLKAHVAAGGGLFPYEVHVDGERGELFVVADLGGARSEQARARITRINGVSARRVIERLMRLTHGDSPAFRARLLEQRWAFYYWRAYGDPARFDIALRPVAAAAPSRLALSLPAASRLPALLAGDQNFERTFGFELRPERAAVLRIDSFVWSDPERFYAFTEDAFAQIKRHGVRRLIVDIRDNGGGDDELWMRGLLRHIADRPYRNGSTYRKRVLAKFRSGEEVTGAIVRGEKTGLIEPVADDPLHYDGELIVLIGPATYSSSVLFANTVQDFGFGRVAGARGGVVRSRQSGSVQETRLPHSGLMFYWPRFVLDRPVPRKSPWLQPDLIVRDDPFDARVAIEQLLALPAER